jgi:hypothetical protein
VLDGLLRLLLSMNLTLLVISMVLASIPRGVCWC